MSLAGFSLLGMNVFHFEAFPCLQENLGSKQPNLHIGSLVRSWPVDGSYRVSDPRMGLWASPDFI
jgi:hypothetical protein